MTEQASTAADFDRAGAAGGPEGRPADAAPGGRVASRLDATAIGVHTDEVAERYDHVIVGAGMAGASAIAGIRAESVDATIGMFGADISAPIYRPDLSKTLWVDADATLEASLMISGAEGSASAPDSSTRIHLGIEVAAIHPDAHEIELADGRRVGYGTLLLATGAEPRVVAGIEPGPRVIEYRTVSDYRRLRELAAPGAHIVVVGGGFVGSEVAAVLSVNEVRVTLVASAVPVLAHQLPAALAEAVTAEYGKHDAEVVAGRLKGVRETDDGVTVTLEDGTELAADAVVVGVGVTPRTSLAEAAGLTVRDGIVVDEQLRASAADVFAAGDVARYPDARLGERRVEHANAAETQGKLAGRNMAGAGKPYRTTPFFWSDMYDYGYEAVGELDTRHTVVEDYATGDDGTPDLTTGVVYYADDAGHVRGVLLWNVWDSVKLARELVARTASEPVADPATLRGAIPLP
jgi:NADPH-dependent 2,4-dienoyl-CoA reductase/sulfur reductase-like enzyme